MFLFDYSENHFSALHLPVLVHAWQKNDFQSNQTNNVLNFYCQYIQCLAEKLAVSISEIRKAAVVFILDELQKSLIHGLKELEICHNLQH